ncbi:VOC family protein [Aquimarina sp. 2201CG1-2-11]|uniref:VOC family protein n=1 Tax=Aquimarina discodermiae TaxID=3231043 RepID=UPI0034624AFA
MKKAEFHLALPCRDLEKTKSFYIHEIGAEPGRYTDQWVDVNLYGNQITFTKVGDFNFDFQNYRLGEQIIPSFHFGVITDVETWGKLYSKLFTMNQTVSTQATFFEKKAGEHLSFFIEDPNGYMVEFKSFKNHDEIFTSW